MYYLNDNIFPTRLVAGQPDFTLMWHWRLGHPSLQKLRSVVLVESFVSTLGCASREFGKHHHVSFPSRVNNRSSSAFELIHNDVGVLVVCLRLKALDIFLFLLLTSLA